LLSFGVNVGSLRRPTTLCQILSFEFCFRVYALNGLFPCAPARRPSHGETHGVSPLERAGIGFYDMEKSIGLRQRPEWTRSSIQTEALNRSSHGQSPGNSALRADLADGFTLFTAGSKSRQQPNGPYDDQQVDQREAGSRTVCDSVGSAFSDALLATSFELKEPCPNPSQSTCPLRESVFQPHSCGHVSGCGWLSLFQRLA
jgi:hypothetical protein